MNFYSVVTFLRFRTFNPFRMGECHQKCRPPFIAVVSLPPCYSWYLILKTENCENFLLAMYKLNGRNEWRCNVAPSKKMCKKLIEARWAGDDQEMTQQVPGVLSPPPSVPSHLSQYRIQLILVSCRIQHCIKKLPHVSNM